MKIAINPEMTERGKFLVSIDGVKEHLYLTSTGAKNRFGDIVGNSDAIMDVALEAGLISPDRGYWEQKISEWNLSEMERVGKLGDPQSFEDFCHGITLMGMDFPLNNGGRSKLDRYEGYLRQWQVRPAPKQWLNALERSPE